jgi:hypothetical protein
LSLADLHPGEYVSQWVEVGGSKVHLGLRIEKPMPDIHHPMADTLKNSFATMAYQLPTFCDKHGKPDKWKYSMLSQPVSIRVRSCEPS